MRFRDVWPLKEEKRKPQEPPHVKALRILNEHLNEEQRASLTQRGWFRVTGSQGGVYRLGFRNAEPVLSVPDDQPKKVLYRVRAFFFGLDASVAHSYCIVPRSVSVPPPDHLLGLMLLLRADEQQFLKIAVAHRRHLRSLDTWFAPIDDRNYATRRLYEDAYDPWYDAW